MEKLDMKRREIYWFFSQFPFYFGGFFSK